MPKPDTSRRLDPADIEHARSVRVADVAVERGIELKKSGDERVGPCPHCGGRDRFAINVTADLFNCRGCGSGGRGAIDFVRWLDGCGFPDAVEVLIGQRNFAAGAQVHGSAVYLGRISTDHAHRQRAKAAWLWSQRLPITGSIAETYLRDTRGIACSFPPTLAFLPPLKPGHHPAMISAFGLCDEVEPGIIAPPREVQAVHLTLLLPDGTGKAEVETTKLMIGSPSGRPIIIAPPTDLRGLAITEGIEDGLSVHQATGLGAWAAGSAPHMAKLGDAVPGWIDSVTIFADADADRQGERGATKLADRLRERGIEVTIEGLDV